MEEQIRKMGERAEEEEEDGEEEEKEEVRRGCWSSSRSTNSDEGMAGLLPGRHGWSSTRSSWLVFFQVC